MPTAKFPEHEKDAANVAHATALEDESDHNLDAAGKFLAAMARRPDADELLAPYTEQEERAVRRKADWIVCPLLFISLSMGAVDKVALGTASILGLRTDLKLVGQQYSWCSSLIFFGQLLNVFPALFLMQRMPTGKVIAINVMIWGVISMCIAATHNYAGLAVCRFMLGFFEALTFPGFSMVISSWYTRREQTLRVAIVFSTLSSFTNGILSYATSFISTSSKVHSWQVLFLLVGSITFITGCVMLAVLPNSPMTAWWLTPRQRCIAVQRLSSNRTGVENKKFKKSHVKEALIDPKSWLVFVANIGLNIPNGGTSTFSSIIINGLGFSVRNTMLLQIPTGLISWAGSLIFSFVAAKTQQRTLTALGSSILPLIGTIVLHVVPRSNVGGSLAGLFIVYFYWAPYILMNAQMIANTGGNTKKTVSYGIAYCGYLVGNLIGPQTFIAKQAPAYTGGIIAMLVSYIAAILMIALYYIDLRIIKRRKDAYQEQHPELESDELLVEWHDESDFRNPRFQYHM